MIWISDPHIREWLPRLQAHRGLWVGGAPQNTLASVMKAEESGYEMAEIDVRRTSDGEVILFHDAEFSGQPVEQITLNELSSQTKITRLEDLLLWLLRTEKFKLNIEIKSERIRGFRLEKDVCALIKKYRLEKRILISSFNPISLLKVKVFCPDVYRALLLSFEKEGGNNLLVMSGVLNFLGQPHVLHLRYEDYSKHFKTLGARIPIVLWTVNEISICEKFKNEIHGIISDVITPQQMKSN